jgi:hypothetical protein
LTSSGGAPFADRRYRRCHSVIRPTTTSPAAHPHCQRDDGVPALCDKDSARVRVRRQALSAAERIQRLTIRIAAEGGHATLGGTVVDIRNGRKGTGSTDHFLWRVKANLRRKITQRKGDRFPSRHVVCMSNVLPFRLGPATWRGHFSLENGSAIHTPTGPSAPAHGCLAGSPRPDIGTHP